MKIEYTPKSGMCAACTKQGIDCSGLPFNAMQIIEKYHEDECVVNIVRCTEFERARSKNEQ